MYLALARDVGERVQQRHSAAVSVAPHPDIVEDQGHRLSGVTSSARASRERRRAPEVDDMTMGLHLDARGLDDETGTSEFIVA